MGQSQSKSNKTPKPGDLIEMARGYYSHWAVYVGDGDVVHVTSPPSTGFPGIVSNLLFAPWAASSSFMSVPTEKAMVRREKLQEAVGNNEWRINNSLDESYEPRSADIIVKEATGQVGNMMEYSVLRKNCEHFANDVRYRKHVSRQASESFFNYFS